MEYFNTEKNHIHFDECKFYTRLLFLNNCIYFFFIKITVSEVFHLLFMLDINCLKASCNFLNCNIDFLCYNCRLRKKEFCYKYHLTNNKGLWLECFNRINFIKPFLDRSWFVNELMYYSSIDFEIKLRELYERIYIREPDSNHEYWKNKLKSHSLVYNKHCFNDSYYWPSLLFEIFLKSIRNTLDLNSVYSKLIFNINLFYSNYQFKNNNNNKNKILDAINIDYIEINSILIKRQINFPYPYILPTSTSTSTVNMEEDWSQYGVV